MSGLLKCIRFLSDYKPHKMLNEKQELKYQNSIYDLLEKPNRIKAKDTNMQLMNTNVPL